MDRPAPLPLAPAHFEQVGEVGFEIELQRQGVRGAVVIADRQPLVHRALPQEPHAADVDQVVAQGSLAACVGQVRIAEVAVERDVVVAQRGAQQDRPRIAQRQVEVREVAGVAVVDALRTARPGDRVAAVVEHRESIAVLQRARAPLVQRGRGGNGEPLGAFRRRLGCRVVHAGTRRCVHPVVAPVHSLAPAGHASAGRLASPIPSRTGAICARVPPSWR